MSNPKRGSWIVFAYYYLAALVGLVMVVIGAVMALHGLVRVALPQTSDEVRYADAYARFPIGPDGDEPRQPSEAEITRAEKKALEDARVNGLGDMLTGAATAAVGGPVMAWHLRQARRREPEWAEADVAVPVKPADE